LNCPSMKKFNEFSSEAGNVLSSCETRLLNAFKSASSDGKRIDAIIIDTSADRYTATVLLQVFSARRQSLLNTNPVLEDDSIVLSTFFDNDEDAWRRNLLLLFKDDVFIDSPSAFTDILFQNDINDSKFNLLVTNSGGDHFINNINRTVTVINDDTNASMNAKVQVINGGEWLFQEDFSPSRSYLPDDYDQTEPIKQWESQLPLGHQFILQMEPRSDATPTTSNRDSLMLSSRKVQSATEAALTRSNFAGVEESLLNKTYDNIGDGCVVVCIWSGGSLIVLWDGKVDVTVNLFTYAEDIEIGNIFESNFSEILGLSTKLRDEQPRGAGRVVSYKRDSLDTEMPPHWASQK